MNVGPEPDGWELMRALDVARENFRREMAAVNDRLNEVVPPDALRGEFKRLEGRLEHLEATSVTRERLDDQVEILLSHLKTNDEATAANSTAMEKRMEAVELRRRDTLRFRRTIVVAGITVLLSSIASIVLVLLHLSGGH
jgi:hypothetical protein